MNGEDRRLEKVGVGGSRRWVLPCIGIKKQPLCAHALKYRKGHSVLIRLKLSWAAISHQL